MAGTDPRAAFSETRRNVAGIDIAGHADHFVCGPRRDDGEHDIAHFGTTTRELRMMVAWLKERRVESVAMESTSVYWIPVADVLEVEGVEVVLVDTREVRMVPGRKSDVKDCQWLQKLHSCGLLRGAFRPPESVTAVRSLLREKEGLTGIRAQCIQQMQKSCDQMNIRVHHAVSDIDGKTGMAIIEAIVGGMRDPAELAKLRDRRCKKSAAEIADALTGTWREEHLFTLEQAYRMLVFADEQIRLYDEKVAGMYQRLAAKVRPARENPPPEDAAPSAKGAKPSAKDARNAQEKRTLRDFVGFDLTAIAGIGYDTAAVVISELGTDLSRFPTERHFASYIGLAPALGKSAGKNVRQRKRLRNTSRAGRALRMAASTLYRSQAELGAFFRSVARRSDRKTAVKATARRMAHIIYRAIRYGADYLDRGAEAFEKRMRTKTLRTVRMLIKAHDIKELELQTAFAAV